MPLEYQELINSNTIVIVLFGLKDCGPCKVLKNKLASFANNNDLISYKYFDISQNEILAAQIGIYAAPSLIFYCLGKEIIKESGCFSFELIKDKINKYLELME